jgi:class 3 adenylate cyclase
MTSQDHKGTGERAPSDPRLPLRRRALRAVFAADVAGFSAQMSVDETQTINALDEVKLIALRQLEEHGGWLFGMPGDGLFALFESAVDAVRCGLAIQKLLALRNDSEAMKLRVGIHLGDVIFHDDAPYGETLNIAARLESAAEPGSILVSSSVMDAVSARVPAIFEDRGVPRLKNIPRQIRTFAVIAPQKQTRPEAPSGEASTLDRTTQLDRATLRSIHAEHASVEIVRPDGGSSDKTRASDEPTGAPPPAANGSGETASPAGGPQGAGAEPPLALQVRHAMGGRANDDSLSERAIAHLARVETSAPPPAVAEPGGAMPPDGEDHIDMRGAAGKPAGQEPTGAISPQLVTDFSRAGRPLTSETIAMMTEALAVHIGPLARIVVARCAKGATSLGALADALSDYIPTADEKQQFRVRAMHIARAGDGEPSELG